MFFGMFSPFYFVVPLIFIFVIARVASGFIRGVTRRPYKDLSNDLPMPLGVPAAGSRRIIPGGNSDEAKIFKLALKLRGRLTVSDVVIETGLSLHETETLLENLVDGVHVRMEVNERGMVSYEFPEIIDRLEGEGNGTT